MLLQVSILSFYFIFIISRKSKTNIMNSSSSSSLHYITPLSTEYSSLFIHGKMTLIPPQKAHNWNAASAICLLLLLMLFSINYAFVWYVVDMNDHSPIGRNYLNNFFFSLIIFFFFTHFYLYSLALFSIYILSLY